MCKLNVIGASACLANKLRGRYLNMVCGLQGFRVKRAALSAAVRQFVVVQMQAEALRLREAVRRCQWVHLLACRTCCGPRACRCYSNAHQSAC